MSFITKFLIDALTGPIEQLGEAQLDVELQKLHDNKPELYVSVLKSGHDLVTNFQPELAASNRKLLVGLIGALNDEINASAAANGVTF